MNADVAGNTSAFCRLSGVVSSPFISVLYSQRESKRLSTQYSKDIAAWVGLSKTKLDLLTLLLRGSSRRQSRKTFIFFLQFCHHNVVFHLLGYLVSLEVNFGGAKQKLTGYF